MSEPVDLASTHAVMSSGSCSVVGGGLGWGGMGWSKLKGGRKTEERRLDDQMASSAGYVELRADNGALSCFEYWLVSDGEAHYHYSPGEVFWSLPCCSSEWRNSEVNWLKWEWSLSSASIQGF